MQLRVIAGFGAVAMFLLPGCIAGRSNPDGRTSIAIINLGFDDLPKDDPRQPVLGVDLTAADLSEILPALKAEKPDLIVIRQHGYWGKPLPATEIGEVFASAYKPAFRTCAWARDPRVYGLTVLLPFDHLVLDPEGVFGPLGGVGEALEGLYSDAEFRRRVGRLERLADAGEYDLSVLTSLRSPDPLSADVDADGRATVWRLDAEGPLIVSPKGLLSVDAARAVQLGIADGLAATREELAACLGISQPLWLDSKADRRLRELFEANLAKRGEEEQRMRERMRSPVRTPAGG